MRIAVLLTVHNRCALTLDCLNRILVDPLKQRDVYLVDDGSTDGTRESVRQRYPEVNVIAGDGNLYWNRGMRRAWEEALLTPCDAYLWLNNDTMAEPGAVHRLHECLDEQLRCFGIRGIAVGTCYDADQPDRKPIYGGRGARGLISPDDHYHEAFGINGNLVLISATCVDRIGILDATFRHSFGDMVYGMDARRSLIPVWVARGYLGACRRNGVATWADRRVPFLRRWSAFFGPKGLQPRELKRFLDAQGTSGWRLRYIKNVASMLWPKRIASE